MDAIAGSQTIHENDSLLENTVFTRTVFSNRNSFFINLEPGYGFGIFAGFQNKFQPYALIEGKLRYENAVGVNGGISFPILEPVQFSLYAALPLPATQTGYTSPVQVGAKIELLAAR
ncbi:MAG: hypothetical protein GF398_15835 [Chitinivibrionales bacterium]|nr:hypothetical protein [Chitinivibrionales bacterium]